MARGHQPSANEILGSPGFQNQSMSASAQWLLRAAVGVMVWHRQPTATPQGGTRGHESFLLGNGAKGPQTADGQRSDSHHALMQAFSLGISKGQCHQSSPTYLGHLHLLPCLPERTWWCGPQLPRSVLSGDRLRVAHWDSQREYLKSDASHHLPGQTWDLNRGHLAHPGQDEPGLAPKARVFSASSHD